jgi:16S rRNA pseudouridine516 synthase
LHFSAATGVKLDRLIAKHDSLGRNEARRLIVARRVWVNGVPALSHELEVDRFDRVELGASLIQAGARRLYLMLHKPVGVVSATVDALHPTVVDLIDDPDKGSLHLVGRLDRNTSGLMLLTNDGRWSKRLMDPARSVPKTYLVETAAPLAPVAVEAFALGFYFHTEDLTTLPARLEILGERRARVTLHEGRYHQIKRMFHRVDNRVVKLQCESIGAIRLPTDLAAGQWRPLTGAEIAGA